MKIGRNDKDKNIQWVKSLAVEARKKFSDSFLGNYRAFELSYLNSEWWERDKSLSMHVVLFEGAVTKWELFYMFTLKPEIFDKGAFFINKHKQRFNEICSKNINKMRNYIYISNILGYFDSLIAVNFLQTNRIDRDIVAKASQVHSVLIKRNTDFTGIILGENDISDAFVKIFAPEILRQLLIGNYEYIRDIYQRLFKYDLLNPETNGKVMVIKLCYMLSLIKLGEAEESTLYGAKLLLMNLKVNWLQYRVNYDYWGPLHILLFCVLAVEQTLNLYDNKPLSLFEKIQPEYIYDEMVQYLGSYNA